MAVHDPITDSSDPRFISACTNMLLAAQNRPQGGYGLLMIDFPWLFENWSSKGADRGALKHYPCMSTSVGMQLPMRALAAKNCAVFMWGVWPLIFDAKILLDAWGFDYCGLCFEWIKKNPETGKYSFGGGYGTRKNLEPCILAKCGKPRLKTKSERDFLYAPRREHSRKPEEAYEKAERMFDGPYMDVFSRTNREGWDSWGNEKDKFSQELVS